jgi:uncharacterized membrane protein YhiD involved in acid resistance
MFSWFKVLSFNAKVVAVCGVGLLLIAIIVGVKSCYTSYQIDKTQDAINESKDEITNSQVDQWVEAENAKDAEKAARNASNASETARKEANKVKPQANVSIDEANKNRCKAYPQSRECKGL